METSIQASSPSLMCTLISSQGRQTALPSSLMNTRVMRTCLKDRHSTSRLQSPCALAVPLTLKPRWSKNLNLSLTCKSKKTTSSTLLIHPSWPSSISNMINQARTRRSSSKRVWTQCKATFTSYTCRMLWVSPMARGHTVISKFFRDLRKPKVRPL